MVEGVVFWHTLLLVATLFLGWQGAGRRTVSKPIDLNKIAYQSWNGQVMSKEAGLDIGEIYLVKNIRPEYLADKEAAYQKEDLVLIKGELFTNPQGGQENVIVIYDVDGKTELFAIYVEDEAQLNGFEDMHMYYRDKNRWQLVPWEISKNGPSRTLFLYFYKQISKLIYYRE